MSLIFLQYKHLFLALVFISAFTHAEDPKRWFSFTFDNDLFVGNDSGYTNGLTFSRFDLGSGSDTSKKGFLLKPLAWMLPDDKPDFSVNGYSVGQLMSTPPDISLSEPPQGELPYAGLLFYTRSYAATFAGKDYADRIFTTVGIVGPLSQAESVQKGVHKLVGSNKPMGWDTQINNELVFQFSRARAWRAWHTKSDRVDIVGSAEISIGTIESSFNTGAFVRVGRDLEQSYPSLLFLSSRISNPVSPKGWQLFFGVRSGYVLNQIFLDGNTFRESRSIEYNAENIGAVAGYSYSFNNMLLTFALYDLNVLGLEIEESQSELSRFGTLTLAFKL